MVVPGLFWVFTPLVTVEPKPPSSTQLKLSQEASFSGRRTTFVPQVLMVLQSGVAVPVWLPQGLEGDHPRIDTPSKPLTFTPRSWISAPCASINLSPDTDTE